MIRRKARTVCMLSALLAGGTLLQLGNCAGLLINFGLAAIDFCALTGTPNCTIGPFAPCGVPNIQIVDENGVPQGEVMNREDDLLLDCPVTFIQDTDGGGN